VKRGDMPFQQRSATELKEDFRAVHGRSQASPDPGREDDRGGRTPIVI
jgi:hypothetical protein